MTFQILALSGGGYRGLFTIEVLARLEQQAGRPIGECFDLIAGTSIGGIIAIGLGMGKTADEIRAVFLDKGPLIFARGERRGWIARAKSYLSGPKYDGAVLRVAIADIVGPDTRIGDARTRLLIPAINMTKGSVQMFKTPHAPGLVLDGNRNAAEVAMATSAAPLLFPLARIDNCYFADGGLVANAPDACALHEAIQFAGQKIDDVRLMSIGTISTHFSLPASLGPNLGGSEWFKKDRLVSTVFSAQQQLVTFMLEHQLGERYLRIDAVASPEQSDDLGLDLATPARRGTLLGMAEGAHQKIAGWPLTADFLRHEPKDCAPWKFLPA
jgi:hypothetical protein